MVHVTQANGPGVARCTRPVSEDGQEILTPDALTFLTELHRHFEPRRQDLLAARGARFDQLDRGVFPDFLPETETIRAAEWQVAKIPADLLDRRVEITGPVDRKMVINAHNSGANVFMADFEDSNAPTFDNNLAGQINLRDAVRRTITFDSPQGKHYELHRNPATLLMRPRGWHLPEKHLLIDGSPISGALFDFGLFLFHNVHEQLNRSTGPYFYLPKLEHYLEARLWNDVFVFSQDYLSVPAGSIRATVLIENILAAFQMDEILWELRDHSSGLNCGRWDYIFSYIKAFRSHPRFVLPDRSQVTMECHFLSSYVDLLIKTCHRRGIHAMGGMAAQIPVRNDPVANERAMERVRQDKQREVRAGHDGTWVAHPGLVPLAREVFDAGMRGANQIERKRADVTVTPADLIAVPDGPITEQGLRLNVDVGIRYLQSWLEGNGCVPIYNLMEDAATAEISRSQVWQWIRHGARLADGRPVTADLVRSIITEETAGIAAEHNGGPAQSRLVLAARLFEAMMTADELAEWLTTVAYQHYD